jgi:hypothetical protein
MTLLDVLETYPYLASNIALACGAVFVSCLPRLAPFRRLVLRLGWMMVPNCLVSALDFSDYWNPERLGGWRVGVEDALWCFNVGALAPLLWALAFRTLGWQLSGATAAALKWKRMLPLVLLSAVSFGILRGAGVSSIACVVFVPLIPGAALILLRPDLWRFSLAGGIGFMLFYSGLVKAVLWFWPRASFVWVNSPPWGLRVWDLPVGELAWALVFGFFWPLFAGYVFDLRLPCPRRRTSLSLESVPVNSAPSV